MSKIQYPTEAEEQEAFVEWLELKGLKFSCIPNATYAGGYGSGKEQRNWGALARLKKQGLRPGLPDLLIVIPNKVLIFIEMKRAKRGLSKISPEQILWIEALDSVNNVGAQVCYGASEAITLMEDLLENAEKI